MARDPTSWTAEERRELRKFIACHCWKHRDGREATPEEMEALALRCEVSGPPPRTNSMTIASWPSSEQVSGSGTQGSHIIVEGPEAPPLPTDLVEARCQRCLAVITGLAVKDLPAWAEPHMKCPEPRMYEKNYQRHKGGPLVLLSYRSVRDEVRIGGAPVGSREDAVALLREMISDLERLPGQIAEG